MIGVSARVGGAFVAAMLAASPTAHAGSYAEAARVWRGPPALPPLPGESAPEPEPAAKPTTPAKPAAKPTTPAAKPSGQPAAKPTAPPSSGSPGPAVSEPPPAGDAPSVSAPPTAGDPSSPEPSVAQPTGDPEPEPSAPLDAELPGADTPAAMPRFPPPQRPPYRGTGLFIGAGITLAVAIAEQVVAHVLVKRRCIDPIQRELAAMDAAMNDPVDPTADMDGDGVPDILEIDSDAERAGELVVDCIPGVVPALALRVHSDIGLLATIGLASAGGLLRARQRAWDDVFGKKPRAAFNAHRISGITLVAGGVVTWFASGAGSWGWLSSCKSTKCAVQARILNFSMRDVSAVMVATGAVLLGFAEGYRRNFDRFERDRALSVGPSVAIGGGGLVMSGRF
jgi:hypothetical protein